MFQITTDMVSEAMEEVCHDVVLFHYANKNGSVTLKHRAYGDFYVIFLNGQEDWDYTSVDYAIGVFNHAVRELAE